MQLNQTPGNVNLAANAMTVTVQLTSTVVETNMQSLETFNEIHCTILKLEYGLTSYGSFHDF